MKPIKAKDSKKTVLRKKIDTRIIKQKSARQYIFEKHRQDALVSESSETAFTQNMLSNNKKIITDLKLLSNQLKAFYEKLELCEFQNRSGHQVTKYTDLSSLQSLMHRLNNTIKEINTEIQRVNYLHQLSQKITKLQPELIDESQTNPKNIEDKLCEYKKLMNDFISIVENGHNVEHSLLNRDYLQEHTDTPLLSQTTSAMSETIDHYTMSEIAETLSGLIDNLNKAILNIINHEPNTRDFNLSLKKLCTSFTILQEHTNALNNLIIEDKDSSCSSKDTVVKAAIKFMLVGATSSKDKSNGSSSEDEISLNKEQTTEFDYPELNQQMIQYIPRGHY